MSLFGRMSDIYEDDFVEALERPRKPRSRAKRRCGFASMDREKQLASARKGGAATAAKGGNGTLFNSKTGSDAGRRAHELGVAYRFSVEKARIAGRLGGLKAQERARARKILADATASDLERTTALVILHGSGINERVEQ